MSTKRIRGYDTVADAAAFYRVSRQQMHRLLIIHGVEVTRNGHGFLILRTELRRKIPRRRLVGVHTGNR